MTIVAEFEDQTKLVEAPGPWPLVWCEELDGQLYPHEGGPSLEKTSYTVFCEEIDGVYYPFTEGGETIVQGLEHFQELRRTVDMVDALLTNRPRAVIFSDVLIFWQKGKPQQKCAPGLCVLPLFEPRKMQRRSFKLWQELSSPIFILELLSNENADMDMETNFRTYRDEMKVPEYFIGDIRGARLGFQGFRLENSMYHPIMPDERGWLWSEELHGWFGVNDHGRLQVWDRFDHPAPDYKEVVAQRDRLEFIASQESRRASREAELHAAAEARIRELEEELRRKG